MTEPCQATKHFLPYCKFVKQCNLHICSCKWHDQSSTEQSIVGTNQPLDQNLKLHSVHYYRCKTIRAPSDHYKGKAKKNQQVLHMQTLQYADHPEEWWASESFIKAQAMDCIESCRCNSKVMIPPFQSFAGVYHSCCFNTTKQKQVLRSMCPGAAPYPKPI
jgi:hypothetical protein